jgi:hypothetical protein
MYAFAARICLQSIWSIEYARCKMQDAPNIKIRDSRHSHSCAVSRGRPSWAGHSHSCPSAPTSALELLLLLASSYLSCTDSSFCVQDHLVLASLPPLQSSQCFSGSLEKKIS